jgi:hypothetical protein
MLSFWYIIERSFRWLVGQETSQFTGKPVSSRVAIVATGSCLIIHLFETSNSTFRSLRDAVQNSCTPLRIHIKINPGSVICAKIKFVRRGLHRQNDLWGVAFGHSYPTRSTPCPHAQRDTRHRLRFRSWGRPDFDWHIHVVQ